MLGKFTLNKAWRNGGERSYLCDCQHPGHQDKADTQLWAARFLKNERRFRAWAGRCLWDAGLAASLSPLYSGDVSRLVASHWGLVSCRAWVEILWGLLSSCQAVDAKSSADPHSASSWAVRTSLGWGKAVPCAGLEGCSNNFTDA